MKKTIERKPTDRKSHVEKTKIMYIGATLESNGFGVNECPSTILNLVHINRDDRNLF